MQSNRLTRWVPIAALTTKGQQQQHNDKDDSWFTDCDLRCDGRRISADTDNDSVEHLSRKVQTTGQTLTTRCWKIFILSIVTECWQKDKSIRLIAVDIHPNAYGKIPQSHLCWRKYVNCVRLQRSLLSLPCLKTGDGKLDADDAKVYWRKLKALLTTNLPNSTGFSLGFFYGIQG